MLRVCAAEQLNPCTILEYPPLGLFQHVPRLFSFDIAVHACEIIRLIFFLAQIKSRMDRDSNWGTVFVVFELEQGRVVNVLIELS